MADDPTEHVQEHIQHTAAHGDDHGDGHDGHEGHGEHGAGHAGHGHGGHASKWITAAALTAAFLAAFAAVAGALSNSHLTESTHKRIDENDKWAYYEAKSLKNYLLQAKNDIVEAAIPPESITAKTKAKIAGDKKKIEENEEIKTDTMNEAKALDKLSEAHLSTHETYETAETIFHIAIAIVAIAVVAKRKEFWFVSIVTGTIGVGFFGWAFIHAPPAEHKKEEPPVATAPEHPGGHPATGEHAAAPEHATGEHPATPEHPAPGEKPSTHDSSASEHPVPSSEPAIELPAAEH